VQLAKNVFDVLADGACSGAKEDANLVIAFAPCNPSEYLSFALGQTQRGQAAREHRNSLRNTLNTG